MRKIVQITATSYIAIALCDDGTVWHMMNTGDGAWHWVKMEDVPQLPLAERVGTTELGE